MRLFSSSRFSRESFALRVDKLAYAALEATLDAYRREAATEEIPVLKMLSMTKDEIAERSEQLVRQIEGEPSEIRNLKFEIVDGVSAIGGGAAPAVQLETKLIALTHQTIKTPRLEQMLRNSAPPVITRIVEDRVLIDLRTVSESDEPELIKILTSVA